MRSIQDAATIALDSHDILYAGDKNEAGVDTGRRPQFLNRYGFHFSTTLWNALEIALRDSIVFSPLQTVPSKFEVYCADGLRTPPPVLIKRIFPMS
jgi:hypothetical protein